MSIIKKLIIMIPICVIGIIADHMTKIYAQNNLKLSPTRYYFDGLFQLTYSENRGAWGSLGQSWSEPIRIIVLIIIPIILIIGFIISTILNKKLKNYEIISYSLIISGGIGNIADRVFNGYVVDMMYMDFKFYATNVFNIADVMLMIGFITLFLMSIISWINKHKKPMKQINAS